MGLSARAKAVVWPLLLIVLTLVAFGRVGLLGFIPFDDPSYIIDNTRIHAGLTWEGVRWALTSRLGGIWMPTTWISLMLDVELFGLSPRTFHLVNLALHLGNALLLYLLVTRVSGQRAVAFLAAGLFAVHPQHVEVVAWAVERKELLATLFGLLALHAYQGYRAASAGQRWPLYVVALGCFLLSLGGKPTWLTLPVLLVLFDYWGMGADWSYRGRLADKLPFVMVAAVVVLYTLYLQTGESSGTAPPQDWRTVLERVPRVMVHYLLYLRGTFWPVDLSTYHSLLAVTVTPTKVVAAGGVFILTTLAAFRLRKGNPALWMGWWWFLVALFPLSGIIQFGDQAIADRFVYLPHIGLFIGIAAALHVFLRGGDRGRLYALVAIAPLLPLTLLSAGQLRHWVDGESYWGQAVRHYPDDPLLHFRLGRYLEGEAKAPERAVEHLLRAVELAPSNPLYVGYAGLALLRDGRRAEAEYFIRAALANARGEADCGYLDAIGTQLLGAGEPGRAAEFFGRALALLPERGAGDGVRPPILFRLGVARAELGMTQDAEALLSRAFSAEPSLREAQCNGLGQADRGAERFPRALELIATLCGPR